MRHYGLVIVIQRDDIHILTEAHGKVFRVMILDVPEERSQAIGRVLLEFAHVRSMEGMQHLAVPRLVDVANSRVGLLADGALLADACVRVLGGQIEEAAYHCIVLLWEQKVA